MKPQQGKTLRYYPGLCEVLICPFFSLTCTRNECALPEALIDHLREMLAQAQLCLFAETENVRPPEGV